MPINSPNSAPKTGHQPLILSRLVLCTLLLSSCNPQKPDTVEPDKIRLKSEPDKPQVSDPAAEPKEDDLGYIAESESFPPTRDQYKPENVCYVGDSYMIGIAKEGGIEQNVFAGNGRPFVSNSERWEGNDIEIKAKKALESGKCHLLILNGGLNDLYSYYGDLDETFNRLMKAYEGILSRAQEMEIPVTVLSIPKIPKLPLKPDEEKDKKLKVQEQINDYTDKLNDFIGSHEGVMLIDSDSLIDGRFQWDKVHPKREVYQDFLEAL